MAKLDSYLGWMMRLFGKHEILPLDKRKKFNDNFLCSMIPGCKITAELIGSMSQSMDETERDKAFESHFPNGASL